MLYAGIAINNGGIFKYRYKLTDHLGNVRATVQRNSSTGAVEILQQDDYYPFGMQYQRFASGTENKFFIMARRSRVSWAEVINMIMVLGSTTRRSDGGT